MPAPYVKEGQVYWYQHVSLHGSRSEAVRVTALESRKAGQKGRVLVRFGDGRVDKVMYRHLHLGKPKSEVEREQMRAKKKK